MKKIITACKLFVAAFLALLLLRFAFVDNVELGQVGVRRSNVGGVVAEDLEPGWRTEVIGLHKLIELPSTYHFLDFVDDQALEIRTKDNNIVKLDISVPYRITPGSAWEIVTAGNHVQDGQGNFQFQRLTRETTIGVLRQHLAELQSSDFYDTDRRNAVADRALAVLNEELAPLHVEANATLIRAVYFRPEYEKQLLEIQLNAQNRLLDGARKEVADLQQELDNFQQKTRALAAARQQEWVGQLARLDRVYQVGFLKVGYTDGVAISDEPTEGELELAELLAEEIDESGTEPGAVRNRLEELTPERKTELLAIVAETFGGKPDEYGDNHLLGIKNIQAETLAYDKETRARADGISARLNADGQAIVAEVMGAYQAKVNQLLNSSAGRAFVAWEAAANVKFAETLTFQSSDGIPSVLRLRDFAEAFMGD